jgi:hypothetical protein
MPSRKAWSSTTSKPEPCRPRHASGLDASLHASWLASRAAAWGSGHALHPLHIALVRNCLRNCASARWPGHRPLVRKAERETRQSSLVAQACATHHGTAPVAACAYSAAARLPRRCEALGACEVNGVCSCLMLQAHGLQQYILLILCSRALAAVPACTRVVVA